MWGKCDAGQAAGVEVKRKKNNNKSFGKTAQIKKRSLPAGKPLKGWLCGGALQCVRVCSCVCVYAELALLNGLHKQSPM